MSRRNVVLMLAQRLRRWPHIRPTLLQCLVFKAETANARHYSKHMLDQCWTNVEDVGPALNQYSTNFGNCQTGVCLGTCHV